MQVVSVNINELKPADYNPRKLTDKDKQDIKNSIERFGMVEPVVVNSFKERQNIIIGGHQRWFICKELGHKEIPVVYIEISDIEKEQELNLRLNKNVAQWDYDLLANFGEDILKGVGFDTDEIEEMFALNTEEDGFNADKEVGNINEAKTKLGDLYELGNHRLLCGDSTKKEDFEKLMGGGLADMVFTDPPYNINYHSLGGQSYNEGKYKGANKKGVFSDNKTPEEYLEFLTNVIQNCIQMGQDKMALFVWNGDKNLDIAIQACKNNKCSINELAVWVKNGFVWSPGCVFHKALEFCVIAFKEGKKPKINTNYAKYQDNIFDLEFDTFTERLQSWFVKRDMLAKYEHPTQKPVKLAEPALKALTERGDIVLDVFAGSGSTLIACEQLKRKCYAIELDPKYCDVIVKRWEQLTGREAKLL